MKLLLMILAAAAITFPGGWETDFEAAKQLAKKENKYILLNFSGSDWCGPCIRLRKEVFDSQEFSQLAESSLVLFNADFPRNRKNQLSKERQLRNESLAERYNPSGLFPFTLVLTADGKVVRSWEGFPKNDGMLFIKQVKAVCDERPK